MPLDLTNIIPIYQSNIDAILNQLGKNVVIYFEQLTTDVPSEFYDVVRDGETKKPDFKESTPSNKPTIVQTRRTIKALLKYNPRDFTDYSLNLRANNTVIRLKTFLTDVPDLLRCKFIMPSSDSSGVIEGKYRLIKAPVPVGLQIDRYAISYWEHI